MSRRGPDLRSNMGLVARILGPTLQSVSGPRGVGSDDPTYGTCKSHFLAEDRPSFLLGTMTQRRAMKLSSINNAEPDAPAPHVPQTGVIGPANPGCPVPVRVTLHGSSFASLLVISRVASLAPSDVGQNCTVTISESSGSMLYGPQAGQSKLPPVIAISP